VGLHAGTVITPMSVGALVQKLPPQKRTATCETFSALSLCGGLHDLTLLPFLVSRPTFGLRALSLPKNRLLHKSCLVEYAVEVIEGGIVFFELVQNLVMFVLEVIRLCTRQIAHAVVRIMHAQVSLLSQRL